MTTNDNDIILDFFAGSGTTGHAVMAQNAEDNYKRRFILIQSPENLDENIKTAKGEAKTDISGLIKFLDKQKRPHNISEITKERLKYSGKEIISKRQSVDIGFKVYKITD